MANKNQLYGVGLSTIAFLTGVLATIAFLLYPLAGGATEEGTCSPRPVPAVGGSPAPVIQYGQVYQNCTISPITDNDAVSFFGNVGDQIEILCKDRTGDGRFTGEVCCRLFDPVGTEIVADKCSDGTVTIDMSDLGIPSLDTSGFYTIAIRDSGNNETETYNLSVNCLAFGPQAGRRCNSAVLPGPPDIDGDGNDELVFRDGNRYFIDGDNAGGVAERVLVFGQADDLVFLAQMDTDPADELVIRRRNRFFIDTNNDGLRHEDVLVFGRPNDLVFPADFDNDGRDELVIRRGNRYLIDLNHDGRRPEKIITFGSPSGSSVLLHGFGSQ